MAKKKAKWLEESTNLELVKIAQEDEAKAEKALDELEARLAETEAPETVEEAVDQLVALLTSAAENIKAAYQTEIDLMDSEEEDDEEEEEEEAPKTKKGKKSKKVEPEEDDEDEDETDYSDWSIKALKAECRERGIKVGKSTSKSELVKALEADDKE